MGTRNVYRIIIAKDCQKSISKAPRHIKKAIDIALEELSADPYNNPRVKPLKGEREGYLRYRMGDYRLIYRIDCEQIIVFAIAFGSRGDIYK